MALLGGLLLGILAGLLAGYLPPDSVLAQGLRPSLPFVVLFLLLLFWPGLRQHGRDHRPARRASTRRRRACAAEQRSRGLTLRDRARSASSLVAVVVLVTLYGLDEFWLLIVTQGA